MVVVYDRDYQDSIERHPVEDFLAEITRLNQRYFKQQLLNFPPLRRVEPLRVSSDYKTGPQAPDPGFLDGGYCRFLNKRQVLRPYPNPFLC